VVIAADSGRCVLAGRQVAVGKLGRSPGDLDVCFLGSSGALTPLIDQLR
jgi:hypothetical protein